MSTGLVVGFFCRFSAVLNILGPSRPFSSFLGLPAPLWAPPPKSNLKSTFCGQFFDPSPFGTPLKPLFFIPFCFFVLFLLRKFLEEGSSDPRPTPRSTPVRPQSDARPTPVRPPSDPPRIFVVEHHRRVSLHCYRCQSSCTLAVYSVAWPKFLFSNNLRGATSLTCLLWHPCRSTR